MINVNYIKNLYIFRLMQNLMAIISNYLVIVKHKVIQYSPNIVKDEIIYFDFETTGLNPYHNKIIEYCFMVHDENNSEISDIIDPEEKIEKKITDITGIHPDMFEGKQNIDYHISKIYNFINGTYKNSIFSVEKKYLVAHNAIGFDSIFLERELAKLMKKNKNVTTSNITYIDSLLLARKLLPDLRSHSLASIAKYYNISSGTHRASSDVVCLKTVYECLIEDLSKANKMPYSYYFNYPEEVINYIYY
jgi:DNA polymerase III alpha subunit (gram-positive type)